MNDICPKCYNSINNKWVISKKDIDCGSLVIIGQEIKRAIFHGSYRSIDLCAFDYTALKVYEYYEKI